MDDLSEKETVTIIIPTYNEALVIKKTIDLVFSTVAAIADKNILILIIDSHSTDNTASIVSALQSDYPHLYLIEEPQKSGLGAAYLLAMQYALTTLKSDIIIEFDADLSHQPKYIIPLLEKIKDYDVVICSRYFDGGKIPKNWGWYRKCASILGNYFIRLMLTPKYKDFTSGFRATRKEVLRQVLPCKFLSNNYAYKIHLLWLLHKINAQIYEYPIEFIDRESGESKLPKNSILDTLRVVFILRFQTLKK